MVLEETRRRRLFRRLEEVLGDEDAEALMTELRAIQEVATRADLQSLRADTQALAQALRAEVQALEQALRAEMQALEQTLRAEMQALEQTLRAEMQALEQTFQRQLDERFAASEQRMDDRIAAAKFEVIATFRGELAAHTRTMIFTMAGTVAALGGLAVALARFG